MYIHLLSFIVVYVVIPELDIVELEDRLQNQIRGVTITLQEGNQGIRAVTVQLAGGSQVYSRWISDDLARHIVELGLDVVALGMLSTTTFLPIKQLIDANLFCKTKGRILVPDTFCLLAR